MDLIEVKDPNRVPSLMNETDQVEFSFVVHQDDWQADLDRFVSSINKHTEVAHEVILVTSTEELHNDGIARCVLFGQRVGYAASINAGIHQTLGRIVVIANSCVEATGDICAPLSSGLSDTAVGMAGPWGLVTKDMREFTETTSPGPVHSLQSYCMAMRRSDIRTVGLMNPKFAFYRNADIDYSTKWRSAGYRLLSLELSLKRHEHREWEALNDHERDKKSRDNFNRFLRAWGDRGELVDL